MLRRVQSAVRTSAPCLALLVVGGLSGCMRPAAAPVVSAAGIVPVRATGVERQRVWEAAEQTLRDRGYEFDRYDSCVGVLTTRPEVSQQFFEFWRRDVATWRDWVEASLNVIRRWVEVRWVDEDGAPEVRVAVYKQRLSAPDRQFNNSGAAYQIFGENLPSTSGSKILPGAEQWIDMGRDPAMEAKLAQEIARRADSPASEDPS